jgi:hypothetical protein
VPPHPNDNYFVRLDVVPTETRPTLVDRHRHAYDDSAHHDKVKIKRRRRRLRLRPSVVFLVALAAWCGWASQRQGGISGTINGWINHVRGDVAQISADPDLHRGAAYYNAQFKVDDAYPQLSDDQISTEIGIGIKAVWCSQQAVVLQGAAGGGWQSVLLLNGRDLGTVQGARGCPGNLTAPAPWKLKK